MTKNFVRELNKDHAIQKGQTARSLGKTREDCPYKESVYSLRPLWLMGYDQQVELERTGRAAAHPSRRCNSSTWKIDRFHECLHLGEWKHPRYPDGRFCQYHKEIVETKYPDGWEKLS